MRKHTALRTLALLILLAAASCSSLSTGEEISKERAVEIARQHLTFEAARIEAVRTMEEGRPLWQVTFRGAEPGQVHRGEILIVNVDRKTGEVVGLAMS